MFSTCILISLSWKYSYSKQLLQILISGQLLWTFQEENCNLRSKMQELRTLQQNLTVDHIIRDDNSCMKYTAGKCVPTKSTFSCSWIMGATYSAMLKNTRCHNTILWGHKWWVRVFDSWYKHCMWEISIFGWKLPLDKARWGIKI